MSVIAHNPNGVITYSPPIQVAAKVTYQTPPRAMSTAAINLRMAAGHIKVIRKAAENTKRLTGKDRF